MAKLSARGCHKVAQASKITQGEFGRVKIRMALRSDGKVLHAVDCESYGRWSRGGYSIIGALPTTEERTSEERFRRYAHQRGFSIDV